MEKIKVKQEANKIFNLEGKHIKTSNLEFIRDFIDTDGFIYVESPLKAFNIKEKAAIRLHQFRNEIKKLYKDYPAIQKSIIDSPVKYKSIYRSPESDPKYGVGFENGTSIYIPERLFNYLTDAPVKHLNA